MSTSQYKVGDRVLVVKGYPSDNKDSWYPAGSVITLRECLPYSREYWLTKERPRGYDGITESYFRKLTKLDIALQ